MLNFGKRMEEIKLQQQQRWAAPGPSPTGLAGINPQAGPPFRGSLPQEGFPAMPGPPALPGSEYLPDASQNSFLGKPMGDTNTADDPSVAAAEAQGGSWKDATAVGLMMANPAFFPISAILAWSGNKDREKAAAEEAARLKAEKERLAKINRDEYQDALRQNTQRNVEGKTLTTDQLEELGSMAHPGGDKQTRESNVKLVQEQLGITIPKNTDVSTVNVLLGKARQVRTAADKKQLKQELASLDWYKAYVKDTARGIRNKDYTAYEHGTAAAKRRTLNLQPDAGGQAKAPPFVRNMGASMFQWIGASEGGEDRFLASLQDADQTGASHAAKKYNQILTDMVSWKYSMSNEDQLSHIWAEYYGDFNNPQDRADGLAIVNYSMNRGLLHNIGKAQAGLALSSEQNKDAMIAEFRKNMAAIQATGNNGQAVPDDVWDAVLDLAVLTEQGFKQHRKHLN